MLVGGFYDIERVPENPIVYVEHGAGQSYPGDDATNGHPAYHGSDHPENVIGYISPSEQVAARWGRPAFAAGCPALDGHDPQRKIRFASRKVAAITFHWDPQWLCPEARSAKPWYLDQLHSMVGHLLGSGFEVIGHWHPRDPFGRQVWINLDVEPVEDPDDVLERAHLLVADNTSLLYEAAALGIPSIVLNAPWYRQDVEHGLRFWDHVPGHQINDVGEFMAFHPNYYASKEKPYVVARSAARYAYALPVGQAGEQAARWIEKLADGLS